MLQIWSVVRLFLSKFGREALAVAREVASDVARNPEFIGWSDAQRREYVLSVLTARFAERYGHVPGFTWVLGLALELAVGFVRQQMKGRNA